MQNNKSAHRPLGNFSGLVRWLTVILHLQLLILYPFQFSVTAKKAYFGSQACEFLLVRKLKIKFEDVKSFFECLLARPAAWALPFDIKSGYHHVEIFQPDQEFLGFSWESGCVNKYFKFTVLPFGLSVGPYIFSKVMRPLVKH